MKSHFKAAAFAGLLALAACGGQGDDTLGDNAAENADAMADNLEAIADNMSNEAVAENLQNEADVNAQKMTPAEKDTATKAY